MKFIENKEIIFMRITEKSVYEKPISSDIEFYVVKGLKVRI